MKTYPQQITRRVLRRYALIRDADLIADMERAEREVTAFENAANERRAFVVFLKMLLADREVKAWG